HDAINLAGRGGSDGPAGIAGTGDHQSDKRGWQQFAADRVERLAVGAAAGAAANARRAIIHRSLAAPLGIEALKRECRSFVTALQGRRPPVHAQTIIDGQVAARLPRVLNVPAPGVLAPVVRYPAHGLGVAGDVSDIHVGQREARIYRIVSVVREIELAGKGARAGLAEPLID